MNQTQKEIWITLAVVSGLALSAVLGYIFFLKPFVQKKLIIQSIRDYNKKCPTTSNGIRIDSISILSEKKFLYHNTLMNIEKEKINIDSFINVTGRRLTEGVKTDSSLQVYRANKITLSFLYRDKNGKLLYEMMVTPAIYSAQVKYKYEN